MCCVPFSQYFPSPHPPVTVLSVSSPIWCPQRAHVQLQDGQRGESTASDPPPPQSERRCLCSDEPKRRFKMTWKTQPHSSHIGSPIQNTTVRTPAKFQSLHRMSQRWRERTRLRPTANSAYTRERDPRRCADSVLCALRQGVRKPLL